MDNFGKLPYFFDEEIKMVAYCPLCDSDLNPLKARVVEGKNDLNLVHIQCHKCKSFMLALILKTASGISSLGLITDLNFNDVYKFKDKAEISADEMINIHKALKNKDFAGQVIKNKD
ncbi:MAG TPA: hypothetical protein ENN28_03840 [Candidatus Uhrbacteria bacterium]|nr:hypothetical protein [Candidatus Uhrbacteria bacterium]